MNKGIFFATAALAAAPAFAQDDVPAFKDGDWSGYITKTHVALVAVNEVGTQFGLVCDIKTDECAWGLMAQPDLCVVGTKVPVLLSGSQGGIASELACDSNDSEAAVLVFQGFDEITGLVSGSENTELAVPGDGRIVVTSFPTSGYMKALAKLQRLHPAQKK
jgi:hypothetical protein